MLSFPQRVPVRVRTMKDPHWSRKFPMKMLLLGSCQRTVDAKQTVHLQFLREYQLFMLGFKRMLVYSLLFQPLLLFQLQLQHLLLQLQHQDLLLQLRHASIALLLLTCRKTLTNNSIPFYGFVLTQSAVTKQLIDSPVVL